MSKRYGAAVIGAGDIGSRHVAAWQLAGHDVVSVPDIDPDRAREVANARDSPAIQVDYRGAIADPDVDIVSICQPLAFPAPVTIYAAEQGKHMMCDKPPARTFTEAAAMQAAVTAAGVQFGLDPQRTLAEGGIDFAPALRALESVGYTGFMGFECSGPFDVEQLRRSVKWVREQAKGADA